MKKNLIVYGVLIVAFIVYNLFFKIENERNNTAVNILFASFIFGYLGIMAIKLLRKSKGKN